MAAPNIADWKAGQIIDDNVFYNGGDMSVGQVQQFLDQKIAAAGGCDTNGTKASELGGGTRAQYGASRGYPAPYTCLNGYYENPSTRENNLSGRPVPSGGISAAQIIQNAAATYNISVRALLVIIQKESPGPLITDTWPFPNQYRNAMGFGCPDTAPCDPQYEGFANQINNAARQFTLYKNNPTSYRHRAQQTNSVLYNPQSSCGASVVYIATTATAGLYNYTPYQPNQAALNNLYGSGDACSAYGNRNFWRMFNDWFGPTTGGCGSNEQASIGVMRMYNPRTFQHFYTPYNCEVASLSARNGFNLEGTLFYQPDAWLPGNVVVHRLYNPSTTQHLWVTTQADINSATQYSGYRYEGPAFLSVSPSTPGAVVVHRLYNPQTTQHLWVTTQAEINSAMQYSGYRYEGPAFWAAPPPS
jgi:hypothetical protein